MLELPDFQIPITEIPIKGNIQFFIKREDQIHPQISGNKYWKLFYNINQYLIKNTDNPIIITFGGAFSNHISAVSYVGKLLNLKTLGIIRGEELQNSYYENPTLSFASKNGMKLQFVSREEYRDKIALGDKLRKMYPNCLIIEEGGTNENAVLGIQHMLTSETKDFHYLCTAVGTGGTIAGISRFCEENQKVIGFKMVKDDSLEERIFSLSCKQNFEIIEPFERYGKITEENIRFISWFYDEYGIPLDPIYTGKMMMKIFQLIDEDYFPENSRILAFHTGGLQGIEGANQMLKNQNKKEIKFNYK